LSNENEVGYGKPPKEFRFEKGRSGNPKGRPKQTKNLKADLTEELKEIIVAREGNRTVKISKQRAVIKSLVAKTVKGDTRAANTLLNAIFRVLDPAGDVAEIATPLNAEERQVLSRVEARFLAPKTIDPVPDNSQNTGDES